MKSKFVFGLIAAMVVLALAPSSFAQVNITIFNVPAAQEIATNRTAETSDTTSAGAGITVSGALIADSNLSSTNLILTLPGNIMADFSNSNPYGTNSNSSPQPSGDPLRIEAATGVFASATLVTRNGGVLTIALIPNAGIVANNQSGSFSILGLRLNVNGLTAPISASASLNNSARGFFLSTSTVPLVTALGPGIGSVTQAAVSGATDMGRIQIFTNRNIVNRFSNIVVTEGFAGAWRSEAQNEIDIPGAANVNAMQMRLTVNGIPAGITITTSVTLPAGTPTLSFTGATSATLSSADTAADTHRQTFTIGGTSLTTVEAFQINFSVDQTTAPSTPAPGDITATLTMAPTSTSNTPGAVPRFTAAEVGPATIGSVVAANTVLLVTYALREGGFDTGIQIANTTADPFGAAGGGATASAGNITFDFFPRNPAGGVGTPFSLTTSSSTVFGGLSSDGTLAAGGSFVALLSEMLSRTSFTGNFSGYIFVRTNFLNAHGTATISDFRTFSLASNVLVLRPPASSPRNSPAGGAEQLTY